MHIKFIKDEIDANNLTKDDIIIEKDKIKDTISDRELNKKLIKRIKTNVNKLQWLD